MRPLVVGVTGINASDNPAPGVGVAKSLKRQHALDVTVLGLAYDAMEPGIYLDRCIDRAFMIPYPTSGKEALVARLLYIRERAGLDVVIPTLDSELPFYIQARDELAAHGIHTFLPDMLQFRLRDKQRLAAVAVQAGIEAPEQVAVTTTAELIAATRRLGYPLMVKGSLYGAHRANTLEEAMRHFGTVAAQWGFPVLVQRAVSGEEVNLVGVGDGEGGAPGMVAIKKMSTTALGKIWSGVTIDHPALLEAARRFVAASHWRGAFELECIAEGERIHLIEINPRFPAWVYFATGVGVNLPLMLVQRALGESVRSGGDYTPGQLYVRYTGERVCDMSQFQRMVMRGES